MEPKSLVGLEQLLASPPDAETKAAAAVFPYSAAGVEYVRGVRLLRSGSFDAAAQALAKLPAGFWKSGPAKNDAEFDEQYAQTPMFSVRVAEGDTNDPAVKAQVLRKDALAKRLADLARTGDTARLGWMYLSTPYIGYDDLVWNGEMVEVLKRASLNGGWPFITKDLAAQAQSRLTVFLNEYDSNGTASRYLKASMDREKAPERAARLALGLWQSLTGASYTESAGTPSARPVATADAVAAMISKQYGRTAAVKGYRAAFEDGCPGLDATR